MVYLFRILLISLPIKKIGISISNQPWIFLTLLFLFVLFSVIIKTQGQYFFSNLKRIFENKNNISDFSTSDKKHRIHISLLFKFFSLSVFSLYAYVLFFDNIQKLSINVFLTLYTITIIFYTLKVIIFKTLGYIFSAPTVATYFTKTYFQLLRILNFILYPILVLYIYVPIFTQTNFIIVSILSFCLFFITLTIKLYQLFFVKRIALFYIFLYLCAVEIMPLFILFRTYSIFL